MPTSASPKQPLIYFVCIHLPIFDVSYEWNHKICDLCDCLLSVSIIFSTFLHVLTCIIYSYCQIIFHAWIYHIWFIHSSVDRHFGCFHFGTIIDNAALNIDIQVLCGYLFSFLLGIYSGVQLLSHMTQSYDNSLFNLLRNYYLSIYICKSGYTILKSHQECMRVPVSAVLQASCTWRRAFSLQVEAESGKRDPVHQACSASLKLELL